MNMYCRARHKGRRAGIAGFTCLYLGRRQILQVSRQRSVPSSQEFLGALEVLLPCEHIGGKESKTYNSSMSQALPWVWGILCGQPPSPQRGMDRELWQVEPALPDRWLTLRVSPGNGVDSFLEKCS